jgi:glutamine synthetase
MYADGADVWRILRGAGVKYVNFVIVDMYGRPRVEVEPIDMARDALIGGINFDGSSIPAYATVDKSDYVAVADPSSVYIETWTGGKSAYVFTYVMEGSKHSPMDPRGVLKAVIERTRALGYDVKVGIEVEYFIVRGNPPQLLDSAGYFDVVAPAHRPVIEEIVDNISACGIGSSKTHHEVAPSQFEMDIPARDPIKVADAMLVFKIMARSIAAKHGLIATFMPKPFWGINGSGAHVHLSVWRDGRNLFASSGEPTEELKYAAAGILESAVSMSAVVAPTVNSYKRLVPHHEAPTRIVWGLANRSALVRVPYYGGRINRIEYRHPDPSMNPYLALAVVTLSAIRGIEERREPPPPVTGVAYELEGVEQLPRHLGEALERFAGSNVARELPQQLVDAYLRLKRAEWESYTSKYSWDRAWNVITEWEYERYLLAA